MSLVALCSLTISQSVESHRDASTGHDNIWETFVWCDGLCPTSWCSAYTGYPCIENISRIHVQYDIHKKTRKQEPLLASVGLCSNIPYVCTLYTLVDRKLVTVKDMTRNGYLQRLLVEPMFLILHLPCSVYGMSVWCLATGVSYSADFLSLCVLVHLLWPTRSYFYFNVDRRQSPADLDDFTYTGICLCVCLYVCLCVLVHLLWPTRTYFRWANSLSLCLSVCVLVQLFTSCQDTYTCSPHLSIQSQVILS